MVADTNKYEFYSSDLKQPKKLVLFSLAAQLLLVASVVLYFDFDYEYLLMINLGVISIVIMTFLYFEAPYWIIICSLIFAVLPNYCFASVRLLEWTLLSLGFSLIFTWLISGGFKVRVKQIDLFIVLYLCIIMISGYASGHLMNYYSRIVVYGFLVFWGTRAFIRNDKQLGWAIWLTSVCGFLIVIQMASNFIQHHPQLITTSFSRREADVSWGSTNYLAALLVLLLPLVLSQVFVRRRIVWKMFSLGLVATMVICVFWTISRTGALCLFVILIMFLFSFSKRKALLFLVGLFMAYYLLTPFISKVESRFSSHDIGSYFSAIERYDLWKKSWNIFKENPIIGVGLGNAEVVTVFKSKSRDPHNIVFKSLAETGMIGSILLLLIFKELFKILFRLGKIVRTTNTNRMIYIGFLVTLVVSIFNRMLEIIGDRYEVIFWFIMGLLFLTADHKTKISSPALFGSKT